MILLTFLTVFSAMGAVTHADVVDYGLKLCQPELERVVSGNIVGIAATSTSGVGKRFLIKGTMRVLTGMGDPGPENASAHHLIRSDLQFTCWLRGLKVRKVTVIK